MLPLSKILPHLLHQFSSEADLVKAIGELSTAFTTDRKNISRYLSDPRLVSAYTAFYLSTNLPKLEAVLSWLTPEFRQEVLGWQLVDVGAGPGTFSLAWKLMGGAGTPVMWESSKLMREQAQVLLRALVGSEARFETGPLGSEKRLLLFGHSANEMGAEEAWDFVKRADPHLVLFIEPGTPEVFQLMLDLRARFIEERWHIVYPCLHTASCPLGGSDWCHQYLDVRHSPDVERLTQLAHKDRRNLPVVVHMYQRVAPEKRSEKVARIVRVFPETKFSHEWEVCRVEGEALVHEKFQLMFKSIPKEHQKQVSQLKAGALCEWETDKLVGDTRRIKLDVGKN